MTRPSPQPVPCNPASMRPGPIGPGNGHGAPDRGGALRPASMRPGPIGPGNEAERRSASRRFPASMRPGPIGPGNNCAGSLQRCRQSGFNEARPNWAGKFPQPAGLGRGGCGFNEARPNWAGKSGSWRGSSATHTRGFNEARPNWAGKCTPSARAETSCKRFNEARPNWAGKFCASSLPRSSIVRLQ